MWHALGWDVVSDVADKSPKYKIMSFYKSQQRKIAAYLADARHSVSVDGAQGSEYDGVILSAGRNWSSWKSVGFLKDRRRVNVAMSRAKQKLIILLHDTLGKYEGFSKQQML